MKTTTRRKNNKIPSLSNKEIEDIQSRRRCETMCCRNRGRRWVLNWIRHYIVWCCELCAKKWERFDDDKYNEEKFGKKLVEKTLKAREGLKTETLLSDEDVFGKRKL